MNCSKCNAELDPMDSVCLMCGARRVVQTQPRTKSDVGNLLALFSVIGCVVLLIIFIPLLGYIIPLYNALMNKN